MSSQGEQLETQPRYKRIWREWRGFVYFVLAMILFRSVIADWNQVPSGSMQPNIMIGDRIVVDKISYDLRVPFTLMRIAQWGDPERGDIVTFPEPNTEEIYVKRLIAIPGDTIEMRRGKLLINGIEATYHPVGEEQTERLLSFMELRDRRNHTLVEESILGSTRTIMQKNRRARSDRRSFGPITVPEDAYFVMGDNRDNSKDSRVVGFIDRERILGRAHLIAFSVEPFNYYAPRASRFFTELE